MTYDYEKDLPCIDLKPLRKEDFLKYLRDRDNWFLSEAMKQHPYLDKIYDQTVNTIRFITLRDPKTLPAAFSNPLPSLHPLDLLVGLCCGAGLRLAVYLRGKNAKKYRHGMEYGSARWGGPKDIEPFMAPKFEDNIILTKTERLMMSNRPPDPKNARNKNVLVVGGSGSGKTRFFIKPNLLQCDSKNFPVSFVVTARFLA